MSNTLYLECFSGISGDMTVAALLDLGANQTILFKALDSLKLEGFHIEITRVKKSGIDACDFRVILDQKHENHDHDMNYLHGEQEGVNKNHSHEHNHRHEQNHSHVQEHSHAHRGLSEILEIISQAEMSDKAKEISIRIFDILGEAEAKAHGIPKEEIHFHEVGAVDSIVDIVSAAVCLDDLNIEEVIVPVLYEGQGFVRCQHGMMPIPVPAVVNIAATHKLRLHVTSTQGELVTPTGAAIVAAIQTSNIQPEEVEIAKVGIGAGKRTYERPSMLRAMLIKDSIKETDSIYKLESNIDDCSGETLGFVLEQLLDAGAKDVFYTPIYMKKNRPAYQLSVLCSKELISVLEQIIFKETTTIGIRKCKMERTVLKREMKTFDTSLGKVLIKICQLEGEKRYYPEYSCVVELCKKYGQSYQEIYRQILREI